MSGFQIRKNDTVVAISGESAGKPGKVLAVQADRARALVEGLNTVKKCLRKSQDNPKGAISEKEAPLPLSKLALYCPACKKGVRIRRVKDGERTMRKCRRCGHSFDA
jgi:large subunit ribosomal protein L24